mmetsp:Transcript_25204/g.76254  ORF Transcript_25204/g.76254 Transcript_25204/m.76254 type:complete len:274 (-) Transcript_25204:132-953(-)
MPCIYAHATDKTNGTERAPRSGAKHTSMRRPPMLSHANQTLGRRPLARRRARRPHLQLRHLVERVAEQPLGHAKVAQLLHAAARPHLGGVVGHVAAALREEPPVAHRVRRLEQRHGGRRRDALLQRLRAEQLEARHLVHLRQLPQVERALRPALLLAEVELVGEEVVDEGGEAGEVGVGHRDLGGVALLHADAKHGPKEHGPHAEDALAHVLDALLVVADQEGDHALREGGVAPRLRHVGGEGGGRNDDRGKGGRRRRRRHADLAEATVGTDQ